MPQPYLHPIIEAVVFRSPIFRDDNWNVGWVLFDQTGSFNSNGDIVTQSPTTPSVFVGHQKSGLSINTAIYKYLVFRIRKKPGSTGTPTYNMFVKVGVSAFGFGETTSPGDWEMKTWNINSATSGGTIDAIQVYTGGGAGVQNEWDFILVCKDTPLQLGANDLISATVTRATSSVDDFSLTLNNKDGVNLNRLGFPSASTDRTHKIYIWMGYLGDDTATRTLYRVFGGTLEELTPNLSKSGDILNVHGRGWARALLRVLVTKEFGTQSDNSTITQLEEMNRDIITSIVNASGNGYQLTTAYIQNFSLTGYPYLLFKHEKAFDAIKHIIDVLTATGNNRQFWVDPSENVHQTPMDSWNTDPNSINYPNALNVGRDQIVNDFRKDIEHSFNQVRYIGQLFKPANGDFWTEGVATTDWLLTTNGVGGTSSVSYDTVTFIVNTKAIKGSWSGQSPGASEAILHYPSGFTLGLDVTKLGGKISSPRLVFFSKSNNTKWSIRVHFETSANDRFSTRYYPGPSVIDDGLSTIDWRLWSIPFGPYGDPTGKFGSPNWNNIQRLRIDYVFDAQKASGEVHIDGLYIYGQVGFIQKDSTRINQYGLSEIPITDNTVREETAHRDLGKAELFRLRNPVLRGSIRVPGIPDILPGQRVTITAPSANLSAATLRVLEVRHNYSKSGFTTELDLTDDLTNYTSLSPVAMAKLLTTQDMPGFRKKEEQDIAMQELDPTISFTTIDNPS